MTPPTFDEWVEWVFAGPEPEFEQLWDDLGGRPADWQLDYSTKLFEAPAVLIGAFPDSALRKGFWALPNYWNLSDLIWDQTVAWDRRRACLMAMFPLFRDFFARQPLGDTCFMWWDMLRYFGSDLDQRVVDTLLHVLTQILSLPSEDCQFAALHGLGHVDHPGKKMIVHHFCERADLSDEMRIYANQAVLGQVL